MRISYLDCINGISGDMFLGACLDAGLDPKLLENIARKLNLKKVKLEITKEKRCGLVGTRLQVRIPPTPTERKLKDILSLIQKAKFSSRVSENAQALFKEIAQAEAKIHGTTPDKLHFHEIGAVDSLVDIVGSCTAIEALDIQEIYASPVPTGSGFQESIHGNLPVPSPAALELLKGAPLIIDARNKELTTPTGAAILKHFCKGYGGIPEFKVHAIGYGVGTWDTAPYPNVLRLLLGEPSDCKGSGDLDCVTVLETNIDDMNPQFISHAFELLLQAGALDVYVTPIQMKESRAGFKLSVIAELKDERELAKIIFKETTSLGIRVQKMDRLTLRREIRQVQTKFGSIPIKIGYHQGAAVNFSPEYKILKRLAHETGSPIKEIYFSALMEAEKKFR